MIEEVIAKLKEEGKSEEEIRAELELIKKDIDAYLGEGVQPKEEEVHEEVDEDENRMHEVFGI